MARLNSFICNSGLWGDHYGLPRFLRLPFAGEVFHIGNHVGAFLIRQRKPCRHVRVEQPTADGVKEVLVSGQCAGWSGAALELGKSEIARLRIEPLRVLAFCVTQFTMATQTVSAIVRVGGCSMAGQIADMALHSQALIF